MKLATVAITLAGLLTGGVALASSHREAPLITLTPKVDGTDFYMFRSYEPGRSAFVTFIANYQPLQDAYGGPNYFSLDPNAQYKIHVDNNGDAVADLIFEFTFQLNYRNRTVPVNGVDVDIPLLNIGPFGGPASQWMNGNLSETYVLKTQRGPTAPRKLARNVSTNGVFFLKPFDNIGNKSIPDYETYAGRYITPLAFNGCPRQGRVFVGQRQEGFAVNLGEVFDLVNTNPVGDPAGEPNVIADKNITTIALEVPISCLAVSGNPIIGAWTTASVPQPGGMTQVSRLSAPLVNEVVIGLKDKDGFNASEPKDDGQFATYVTNPTLPELLEILFGVRAPNLFPRTDLIAAFLTGIDGLNKPAGAVPAEMMRLNTSIPPKVVGSQNNLGVLGGDLAGFPNGRRPGDDVVDIELRVAMGVLLSTTDAPDGQLPYTDGATLNAADFRSGFPYLNTPIPGSPNEASGEFAAR